MILGDSLVHSNCSLAQEFVNLFYLLDLMIKQQVGPHELNFWCNLNFYSYTADNNILMYTPTLTWSEDVIIV